MTTRHTLCGALLVHLLAVQSPTRPTADALVQFVVIGAGNKPVTDLTAADFDAYVNGAAVPIASVVPRGPLSLAVIVDTTRSTGWGGTGIINPPESEVLAALASLRDGDRIRFGSFGPRVRFKSGWKAHKDRDLPGELKSALDADARETHGPSPIWDAVYDTVAMLSAEPPPRAILLLSDGRATGNSRTLDLVADHAAVHGVVVHTIVRYFETNIPQGEDVALAIRPWVSLDQLTTFTGGSSAGLVAHDPLRGMALSEQLGWAMRDSYVMRVALPADGALHGLDIRTRQGGLTILAPVAIFSPRTQ